MSSKVREFRLPITVVFAGSAFLSLGLCAGLASADVDPGVNLAIVGLFLGLLIPLGVELRNRSGRPRRVTILDYRTHQFGHAIARGATKVLASDKRRWHTEYKSPNTVMSTGAVQWQIREIQSAVIEDVDGMILVPAGEDESLWFALAAALKSGMFVVVVDTKPPNKIFRDVGIEAPRFVSSNYAQGGVLIGHDMLTWLHQDSERSAILWIGPEGSWPGEERSRNIVYLLASNGYSERFTMVPLTSWAPDAERCRNTLDLVEKAPGSVTVYCADDENAMALHLLTITERPALRSRMRIVGCNGTPDDWGNVPCIDMRAADVTVDIHAEEQGAQAAMLLVRERSGKLQPSERSVYIAPTTLNRGSSAARWMDRIFDGVPDDHPSLTAPDRHDEPAVESAAEPTE